MTDPVLQTTLAQPRTPGWMKAVLAVSVALNLGIAGLALGAFLADRPDRGRMPRDPSFGPFTEALSREDRRALRLAFEQRMPEIRPEREAARAEVGALLAAIQAEPFDPAAVTAALQTIEDRLSRRIDLGRSLLEEHILSMSDADRDAFADRLAKQLQRRAED